MKTVHRETAMQMAICFAFLLAMSQCAEADTYLDINVGSNHGEPCYQTALGCEPFIESNPGLGITFEEDDTEVSVGFYENSYGATSVYLSGSLAHSFNAGPVEIRPGIEFGAVSGYSADQQPPVYLLPSVSVGYERVRVNVGYFPAVSEDTVSVTTVQLQVRIDR